VESHGVRAGVRLAPDPAVQLDRRVLERPGHALPHVARGVQARHRVLRRDGGRRRLPLRDAAQALVPATFNAPTLGLDFEILDEDGERADEGELFLVPPSIGLSTELLDGNHDETYFAGVPAGSSGRTLRRHGDRVERLAGGYYRAHGRVDDTMNLAGMKFGSAEIERS